MLKPQVHPSQSLKTLFPLSKPFLHGNGHAFLPIPSSPSLRKGPKIRVGFSPSKSIKAVATSAEKSIKVKAVVTVKPTVGTVLSIVDDIEDMFGKSIVLELVSSELDPSKYSKLIKPDLKLKFPGYK